MWYREIQLRQSFFKTLPLFSSTHLYPPHCGRPYSNKNRVINLETVVKCKFIKEGIVAELRIGKSLIFLFYKRLFLYIFYNKICHMLMDDYENFDNDQC